MPGILLEAQSSNGSHQARGHRHRGHEPLHRRPLACLYTTEVYWPARPACSYWASRVRRSTSGCQQRLIKQPFAPDYVEDVYPALLVSVDGSARRLDDLPIPPPFELWQFGSAQGMSSQLTHMLNDTVDERSCRGRIVQGDVVGYRLKIAESGFRPDYFSHRDRRCLAWAWLTVRPSSMAFSPRAIPSSSFMRCWRSS